MKRAAVTVSLILLAVVAQSAVRQRPTVVGRWNDRLARATDAYAHGSWSKGRDLANSVLGEMIELIASGPDAAHALATGFLLRAIGEAGTGHAAEATWDFGSAQALFPAFSGVDLQPYVPAATLLETWRYTSDGSSPVRVPEQRETPEGFTPPRYIRNEHPSYPGAKRYQCSSGKVEITSVITATGEVQAPQLSPGVDPVLAAAALNTVREWRFVPATVAGHAVAVNYILSVNFRVAGCR